MFLAQDSALPGGRGAGERATGIVAENEVKRVEGQVEVKEDPDRPGYIELS